jgi:hypothetical protein
MRTRIRSQGRPITLLIASLALVAAGCGGDDGHSTNTGNDDAASTGGDCVETALFPLRAMGDPFGEGGSDVIRKIQEDAETGDLFFTNDTSLYRLTSGANEPAEVALEGGAFFLTPDLFLFPGGLATSSDPEYPILRSMPRSGGETTVIMSRPKSEGRFTLLKFLVVGDQAIYERLEGLAIDETDFHVVEMQSWKAPGSPIELYRTPFTIEELTVAGGTLYLHVWEQSDTSFGESYQVAVDLETRTVAEGTSQEKLGGEVIGGDDDWILVEKNGIDNPGEPWGLFRMRPDGTEAQAIKENSLALDFSQYDGTWVIETLGGWDDDTYYVNTYTATGGLEEIGCINGEDTSTLVFQAGKDAVYVGVDRSNKATILKIPF